MLDIKSKNNNIILRKLETFPITLIILICFLLTITYLETSTIINTYHIIQRTSNELSNFKNEINNLDILENSDNPIYINYDFWLKECAKVANVSIYNEFNNLKILSSKSQKQLNELSKTFKLTIKDIQYDDLVKYIIIDKSKKTFITNDIQDLSLIEKNIERYKEQNGELFKYISSKGKWYHITYDSNISPAYKYLKNYSFNITNSSRYVEAYWFPKEYKITKQSKNVLSNFMLNKRNSIKNNINTAEMHLLNDKKSLNLHIAKLGVIILLILSILYILFKLDLKNIIENFKNGYLYSSFTYIINWFENRNTLFKIIIYVFLLSLTLLIIAIFLFSNCTSKFKLILFIWILFNICYTLPKFIKFCLYIDKIHRGTLEITNGNLEYVIPEIGDKKLSSLAQNINKLNKGFKVSIEDQIKNEKLKSELVANVSHDLKTPLTSIINYTDILLKKDIEEEKKEEYLQILNRKSLKLKTLIEDLFEVSKMNSGKLKLEKNKVNVVELLNQSIAEYSDTDVYSSKNLNFILNTFQPVIDMNLDGHRMSRVFENLINNALKYSLKNSRVFVDIDNIKKGIKIIFKNTSFYPLDFDKKDILERFTRGDKSRNSNIEGNGLGLAIAKSIVELHGGIMYIDFDGDLFKVIIELYY